MRRNALVLLLVAVCAYGLTYAQQPAPQWWDLNAIGSTRPSPRTDPAMAPTSKWGEVLLFGGQSYPSDLNDTWVWTADGWAKRDVASPPTMKWARMVYDSWRSRNVLVGYSSDRYDPGPHTWVWGGEEWSELEGPSALRAEPGFSLAFDESTGEVVLFGGEAYGADDPCLDDTWVLRGGAEWTWVGGSHPPVQPIVAAETDEPPTFTSPPARAYAAMAYDRTRGEVVLHGGVNQCGYEVLTDTWVWGGSSVGWTERLSTNPPPASDQGYQMAYYGLGGYLIAAGCGPPHPCGMHDPTPLWKWNGTESRWEEIPQDPMSLSEPLTAPTVVDSFGLSEVTGYDGLLLFGGQPMGGNIPPVNDTWAWGELPEILNTAPTAVMLAPAEVFCTAPTGALIHLDGSTSSDPEHQALSFTWTGPFGTLFSPVVDGAFPVGLNSVTLTVSDGSLEGATTSSLRVTVGVQGLESPLGPLVRMDAPPPPAVLFEAGRTLPLKLELACGGQLLTSADVAPPVLVGVAPVGGPVSGTPAAIPPTNTSDAGGVFRSQNTKWVYNLSTKELLSGSYELLIQMPDGLRYRTIIALR